MDLFERLEAEHTRIHTVAGALDVFADTISGGRVDLHEVIRFVTFFRGYVDGLHHAREELVLLPCLEKTPFARDAAPLAYIHDQHRKEATLLFDLEQSISARGPWRRENHHAIATAARTLTVFERLHMAEERKLLFPEARRELASHEDALGEAEARFGKTRARSWDVPWLEKLGDDLVAAHPRAPA